MSIAIKRKAVFYWGVIEYGLFLCLAVSKVWLHPINLQGENNNMTTNETITNDQIHALEHEASEAGDEDMFTICRLALYGASEEVRVAAIDEIVKSIQSAEVMR